MQKMGYKARTGLGKDADGRVDPVPAFLYPSGVSLGLLRLIPHK